MATIKVLSNRKLDIPNQLQLLIGVETENISEKITFQIPRTVGTNGLDSLVSDVILLTENTSFKDEIILTDKTAPVGADYILAVWTVERKSLIAPSLTIQIKVADQLNDKIWISSTRDLTVETEIDADGEILNLYPSILDQLRTDVNAIDDAYLIEMTDVDTYLGINRVDGNEHLHLNERGDFIAVEPPAGGYSNNLYFGTTNSDILGYKVLTYTPDVL